MTKTTTRCNRCDSEVSFKKEHISNDDYYCACLECDEDLFKFETYEDKKGVIMNNTNTMRCPMCEEGVMEHKNIKGLHTYSCDVCSFQGIEGIDQTIGDLIEKATKGENKMTKERKIELLIKKWYNFNDYKENDYREVFNYESLYIGRILLNVIHINDINFDEVIEELNYNKYEVIEHIIEDIESVGIDYVSMLGMGMSVKEWKKFIKDIYKTGENKMKDYLKIVENNNDSVVIKVKELTNLQIAQKPCFDSSMDYITITRGSKQVLTVINKKGGTFSFHWGIGGYTLISDNLQELKRVVLRFLEDNDIFIKLINNKLPLVAKSFKNNNFDKWQFRLGDTDENSHNLFFDTEEQLKDKANKLGYKISRIVPNQYVGAVVHYERRK